MPGFENLNPADATTMAYCLQNWTSGDNIVGKLKTMFADHGIEMIYKGNLLESNIYTYKGNNIALNEALDWCQ